ncbi:MAG: nucleotidyltransferase family protein [Candidatus Ratteibacteria bacterium]|nr:nucleotidyltransferase family protein [Candidatus Ratteibacteria bacterium]
MKALILAGGYGTRLYPLTESMPKSLLDVNGRPIIEYILEKIATVPDIKEIYMVVNEKFHENFKRWNEQRHSPNPVILVNNGTTDDSNKLGAIKDIKLVIDNENIDDELLIIAGDNLFDFGLKGFYDFWKNKKSFCIGLFQIDNLSLISKYSNVRLGDDEKIIDFVEKPLKALSNLIAICLYMFPKKRLPVLNKYLEEGNNPDAPGYFIQWLVKREKVYGYRFSGKWLDIGDINSYNKAKEEFHLKEDI